VHYPVMPWIGIMALGYYFGGLYHRGYDAAKRKKMLLWTGASAIALFIMLRSLNIYGDAAEWSLQKNTVFTLLSFLNVTKYPPSLLYMLITLGPAFIFLALAEKPLNTLTEKIAVFGRVPFFYYVIHIYAIHLLAMMAAYILGYHWWDMVLTTRVNLNPALKNYGFSLATVYVVWLVLVLILFPCCQWFDRYKRTHQATKSWLTYL
jgi:uncharacterized membrane protein